jgi:hypothetical protein
MIAVMQNEQLFKASPLCARASSACSRHSHNRTGGALSSSNTRLDAALRHPSKPHPAQ